MLSFSQLLGYAQNAGFTGQNANTISAIALAESGGNPNATNVNTNGSTDYGVTQINSIHPGASGAYGDPQQAMNLAYGVSGGGTNFTPWVTYNKGTYLPFLNSNAGATAADVPASGSGISMTFDPNQPASAGGTGTGIGTTGNYGSGLIGGATGYGSGGITNLTGLPGANGTLGTTNSYGSGVLGGYGAGGITNVAGLASGIAGAAGAGGSSTAAATSWWDTLIAFLSNLFERGALIVLGLILIAAAAWAMSQSDRAIDVVKKVV
jgi:hypothetical protein